MKVMRFFEKHFIEIAAFTVFLILLGMWTIFQVPFLERLTEGAFSAFLISLGLRKPASPQTQTNIETENAEITQHPIAEDEAAVVDIKKD